MKERPILFSGPMVRALLDGTKTQTRRVVKPRGHASLFAVNEDGSAVWSDSYIMDTGNIEWRMRDNPYGQVGDRLWVRETWSAPFVWEALNTPPSEIDPSEPIWHWADGDPMDGDWMRPKPSIHMPRWASRLTLEITDIRVERLQDISEADAMAEGAEPCANGVWFDRQPAYAGSDAKGAYYALWEAINGKGSWDVNPWVWVIGFEVVK